MTSTQDVTGRQLPLVTEPVGELGEDWLHAMEWENTGVLAGVTDCRRSQKWGCRGRLALGFKPRHGSHAGAFWDHSALAKVGTMQLLDAPF